MHVLVAPAAGAFLHLVLLALLIVSLRSAIVQLRTRAGPLCPRCGYSTVGLKDPTCPECGLDFDGVRRVRPRHGLLLKATAYAAGPAVGLMAGGLARGLFIVYALLRTRGAFVPEYSLFDGALGGIATAALVTVMILCPIVVKVTLRAPRNLTRDR